MKIYHKLMLPFMALLLFQPAALAGDTYSDLAVAIANDITPLLMKHNICENIRQCYEQTWKTQGGNSTQAHIRVYKADNFSSAAIQDIVRLCLDAYALHKQKQSITLRFYRENAVKANAWFFRAKPFIYLELKGGN